jgi:hypothetical protein
MVSRHQGSSFGNVSHCAVLPEESFSFLEFTHFLSEGMRRTRMDKG